MPTVSPALRSRSQKAQKASPKPKGRPKKVTASPQKLKQPSKGKKSSAASAAGNGDLEGDKKSKLPLPVHVPSICPLCTTCDQAYGASEKDLLPAQVPLKWRTFNVKQIEAA
jgi:hypothetical protein